MTELIGYRITKVKERKIVWFFKNLYNLIIKGEWETEKSIIIEMWKENREWKKISSWREA
jgi:hypothetical protein